MSGYRTTVLDIFYQSYMKGKSTIYPIPAENMGDCVECKWCPICTLACPFGDRICVFFTHKE